jgi:hypothetical protein
MLGQAIDLQQRLRGAADVFNRLKHVDRWAGLIHD